MDVCNAMTQEELNSHGRSDYDVNLDGDKPCFFVKEHESIDSKMKMSCKFDDESSAHSGVWEDLSGYTLYYDNITFDYCVGSENSSFALSSEPPFSYIRIKIFNFARVFNNSFEYFVYLGLDDWSGNGNLSHTIDLDDLPKDYKVGGRIYYEYQMYVNGQRMTVERRFYDIDNWKMPKATTGLTDTQITILVCCLIAFVGLIYMIYKCNKWCQKLEHEKND